MRLSVIIATKDLAGYLDQALRSLSLQIGAPPFETIVVDNGSADATPQIVDHAREGYEFEITYVFEERPNRGAARNRGLAVARGEYFIPMDADNVARQAMIERFVSDGFAGKVPAVVAPETPVRDLDADGVPDDVDHNPCDGK